MSSGAEPRRRRPLAVTMGDPAGIGLEITLRAWLERSDKGLTPFVVFADKDALAERTRLLGLAVPLAVVNAPGEAPDVFGAALPVLHSPLPVRPRPGDPDAANAAVATLSDKGLVAESTGKRVTILLGSDEATLQALDGVFGATGS